MLTKSQPRFSKYLVISILLFGVGNIFYKFNKYDYFSKENTDAHYLYVSMLTHLGIVIGPATVFGINNSNFTVYPSKFKRIIDTSQIAA
jgi:hypothetical protein